MNSLLLPDVEKANPWNIHRESLKYHFENGNISEFMSWSTIRATMYVGDGTYLREEIDDLKNSPDWSRYAAACMRSSDFGNDLIDGMGCNALHQACHLYQWEKHTGKRVDELSTIVEFGGGYGEMARVIYALGFRGMYHFYDLPEMLTVAGYYLSQTHTPVILSNAFSPIKHTPDLFIALVSLSEVPLASRARFMKAIRLRGVLCLYQGTFDPHDNMAYFAEFQKTYSLPWQSYPAPRMPSHHYLIA